MNNSLNIIVTWSIPHTGTHFVMDMQRQGIDPRYWCRIDDMWWGNHYNDGQCFEEYPYNDASKKEFISIIDKYRRPNDKISEKWDNLELILIKAHHWYRNKRLHQILKSDIPLDVHFVSPMRDPFLAIMTRAWQGWHGYGKRLDTRPDIRRKEETRRIVQTYIDQLIIPKERLFIYPIDMYRTIQPKDRTRLTQEMYEFCGLKFNFDTNKFLIEWQPVNTSQSKSNGAKQDKHFKEVFQKMKDEYANGNKEYILSQKFCAYEFKFLQKEECLKKLLEQVGYKNLLWF